MKGEYYDGGNGVVEACMSPEAFMKKVAEDGKKSISAPLTKLGYINCDLAYHHPQRAVMMKGLVVDAKNQPMSGVQLWGTGRDYAGRTPDVTGSDGSFGAMIAQFDSSLDIEVQYRRQLRLDDKIEVCFDKPGALRKLNKDIYQLVAKVAGQYLQDKDASCDGQPVWIKKGVSSASASTASISWSAGRRPWQNCVGDKVVFCWPVGDVPGLPFGDGWRFVASTPSDCLHVPKYTRTFEIVSQSFGPFTTGPPGEFVDVGVLTV